MTLEILFSKLVPEQRSKVTVQPSTVRNQFQLSVSTVHKLSISTNCKNRPYVVHGNNLYEQSIVVHGISQTGHLCRLMPAGVHTYRVAEDNMAVKVVAMGPVQVQGRQVTAAAVAGYCNMKGCPADHRSCALVDVSLWQLVGWFLKFSGIT